MNKKVAAVVVLYNPDKNYIKNINTYLYHVSLLVIVDNSEIPDYSVYSSLENINHVKFVINKENTGISKAINDGIKLAVKEGAEWVLTMDQDSFFENNMIENYLVAFNEISNNKKVAVIGPVSEKRSDETIPTKIKEVTSLITSGSLINTSIFSEVGGYNEKLFIDEVDHEYCYRIKMLGYSVLQVENIFLNHTLGSQQPVKTLTGKKKVKTLHSPIRLYYIVRNCCFIIKMYKKQFPEEIKLRRKDLAVRIKNNLLYGPKKFSLIKHILLGFVHFKRKRFGKL